MAQVDLAHLSECFRRMRNADPKLYERAIRLLDAYVNEVTVAVTEASVHDIMNAQGRAQMARKFFQVFTELREPEQPPSA